MQTHAALADLINRIRVLKHDYCAHYGINPHKGEQPCLGVVMGISHWGTFLCAMWDNPSTERMTLHGNLLEKEENTLDIITLAPGKCRIGGMPITVTEVVGDEAIYLKPLRKEPTP